MIINVFGPDNYRSHQYLSKTIEEFKKKRDPQGYNVIILNDLRRALSEIKNSPFLAEKRLVVIKNLLSSKDSNLLSSFIEIIKSGAISDSNIVVFHQTESVVKAKENKELDLILRKQKYSQEFNFLKGAQLANWIKHFVNDLGGKIEENAVDYLVLNVSDDMWRLSSLLDQLVAYSSDNIKIGDIQLFLDEKVDDNIFNMVDAIVSGNKKIAIKLLKEQRRLGEEEPKLFGLIVWQFRTLLEMRSFFDKYDNCTSQYLAQQLGIHPFVVRKNFYLIKKNSLAKLKKIHWQLLEIDQKTKTGQGGQDLLLDLFVFKS